jgi:hypothetical protein
MAKTISTILGVVLLLVGLLGFLIPNFAGTHLSTAHNLIHLASGAAALYFGLAASASAARLFAIIFGLVYFLLGVTGFFLGSTGTITLPQNLEAGGLNERMFRLIPGVLELGTMDHVVHLLVGFLFLAAGFLSRAHVRPLIDDTPHT